MSEIYMLFPEFKPKALTLSFDDGTKSDIKMVEILDKYGIKCTFNLNSGLFDKGSRISADQVAELYKSHEVAAHGYNHLKYENIDDLSIIIDIYKDRKELEKLTSNIIKGFAYPYGINERERISKSVKEAGILYGRTTKQTLDFSLPENFLLWDPTCHCLAKELTKLTEEFLKPIEFSELKWSPAKLFYIWGHSYEFKENWQACEDLCKQLGAHNDVWYASNMEIMRYILAYRSLEFSAAGNIIYNPSNIEVFFYIDGKKISLKPNDSIKLY